MAFETLNSLSPSGGCEVGTGTGDTIQLSSSIHTVSTPLSIHRPVSVRGTPGVTMIQAQGLAWSELFYVHNPGYPGQEFMEVVFDGVILDGWGSSNFPNTGIYAPANVDPTLQVGVSMYRSKVQYFTWGGVYFDDAHFYAEDSTFQFNSSSEDGGGLRFFQRPEFAHQMGFGLKRCAVIGNHSAGNGGGIFSQVGQGIASLTAVTVSNNSADNTGGGVYSANGQYLNTLHTTIAYNQATAAGGGFASGSATSFNFNASIISDNVGPWWSPDGYVPAGLSVAFYDTLVGNTTGLEDPQGVYLGSSSSLKNLNPLLDANYFDMGGAAHTVVHRLLPGSPALDRVNAFTEPDQRGFPGSRDGDGNGSKVRDLGAYEHDPNWQTEVLLKVGDSGDAHVLVSTAGSDTSSTYSNGLGTNFQSNASNDFVTYAVPIPASGNYNVRVRVRKGSNRGKFRLAWSDSPTGPWTNVGGVQDLYSSVSTFTELNINASTPVNIPWAGHRYFRFLVQPKNSSSTGHQLFLDYIRLNKL
jgi:predicted outer membrane repeat protein